MKQKPGFPAGLRNLIASSGSRLVTSYACLLVALIVVRAWIGDRGTVLFALNSLFLYAFAPLPLVAAAAVVLRRVSFFLVALVGGAVWVGFWGELFVPRAAEGSPAGRRLVVLSYNALGYSSDAADTIRVIAESQADVVALHELNPETAAVIERELQVAYPHRWLEPRPGVTGGGILSKLPFTRESRRFSEGWIGPPMSVVLDVRGTAVGFVRFHAVAGPGHVPEREEQARELANLAQARARPLIVAGDLNATDQNGAYAIVAQHLRDAWRDAGSGFGHTFPGVPTAEVGGSRPVILGLPVPLWLVRIDYVFHSDELRATGARTAWYGGASDHRGVVATLTLP